MEKDKKLYEFNSLEFLNAGVDEIYYRKKHYISGKDTMFLKSMMAGKILQFERMCGCADMCTIRTFVYRNHVMTGYSKSSSPFYMSDFMVKNIV